MSERQINKTQENQVSISTLKGVICSDPGCHTAPVFKRVYDNDIGKSLVTQVDETDIYEFIQASKSSTDLANLQQRFIALGEIPNVDPTLTSVDTTILPDNIHQLYSMVNDVNGNYAKLPDSIKAIFGTPEAYMKALLDGTYNASLINALNKKSASADTPAATPKEGE